MKRYLVRKAIRLGYDSHVRAPTPSRFKEHQPGSELTLSSEAPDGTVWFIDSDGERGKIDCGEVRNLTADGRVRQMFP